MSGVNESDGDEATKGCMGRGASIVDVCFAIVLSDTLVDDDFSEAVVVMGLTVVAGVAV